MTQARYGIWGKVRDGNNVGRLCVLHNIESREGYEFFQKIANRMSPGYGQSMEGNWDSDWASKGKDLVYTIDPSNDGSQAEAFALVQPKGGGLKLTFLMTREDGRDQGFGFLLLKWVVFRSLKTNDVVFLENSVKPQEKGKHIYETKMKRYFGVEERGDYFYYSPGALEGE